MSDSEVAELCRRIYERHQRALELIFEHRPDRLAEIQALLLELIRSRDDLIPDASSKQAVRFGHVGWEGLPKGKGWTPSGRLVLFEFNNYPDRLDLKLWVGPGPAAARRRLIALATARQPPFRVPKGPVSETQSYKSVFSRSFLRPEDYEGATLGGIEARIRAKWEEFLAGDLPTLVAPIEADTAAIAAATGDGEAAGATPSGATPDEAP